MRSANYVVVFFSLVFPGGYYQSVQPSRVNNLHSSPEPSNRHRNSEQLHNRPSQVNGARRYKSIFFYFSSFAAYYITYLTPFSPVHCNFFTIYNWKSSTVQHCIPSWKYCCCARLFKIRKHPVLVLTFVAVHPTSNSSNPLVVVFGMWTTLALHNFLNLY